MSGGTAERRPPGEGTALDRAGRASNQVRGRVALAVPDTAATAPALLSVGAMRGADDRTVNEITGFLVRAAALGCRHNRAPLVDMPTLELLGGARTAGLVRMALRAGLLTRYSTPDGGDVYRVQPVLVRTVPDRAGGE